MEEKYKCSVCGSTDEKHMQEDEHGFYVSSKPDQPLALTVSVQRFYDEAGAVARFLAFVQAEMAKHFPGKRFAPFLPHSQIIVTREGNSVILGYSHVTRYITYELP